MKKDQSGFGLLDLLLIIGVIVLIGLVGWLVFNKHHKSATALTKTGTFEFSGYLFPDLPKSYRLINKTTSISNPEINYITSDPENQITQKINNICRAYNFTGAGFNHSDVTVGKSPTLVSLVKTCSDKNNSWSFSIDNAIDLKYYNFKPPLASSLLNSNLTKLYWAEVGSDGPPAHSDTGPNN